MLKARLSRTPLLALVVSFGLALIFYLTSSCAIFQKILAHQNRTDMAQGALAPFAIAHDFYFLGLLLVLPLIYVCKFVVDRINLVGKGGKVLHVIIMGSWGLIIAALLYLSDFLFFIEKSATIFYTPLWTVVFLACLILCVASQPKGAMKAIWGPIAVIFALGIYHIVMQEFLPFRSQDMSGIDDPWTAINFNAAFYSIVQAASGKLDLIDYYAQYGNYCAILRPIFTIVPLSLNFYSAIMTGLTVLVFACQFLGLRYLKVRPAIAAVAVISIYFLLSQNLAFQYWAILPIRTIFPSAAFLLIARFGFVGARHYFITTVCVLAVLWNMDTGLVLLLAWLLTRAFLHLQSINRSKAIKAVCVDAGLALAMIIGTMALYAVYTYALRGVLPQYQNLFLYQRMYFGKGLEAAPFGLFDGWGLVILIYIIGLVHAFTNTAEPNKIEMEKNALILFLSFFGLGTFSYYVVRSVPTNIFLVMMPAILLLAIGVESFLRQRHFVLAAVVVAPLVYWSVLTSALLINCHYAAVPNRTDYNRALQAQRIWIESLNLAQQDVIILSDNSGIFYLESHANCPLSLPSITEAISPKFAQRIEHYASDGNGLIIFDSSKIWFPELSLVELQMVVKSLPVVAQSPDGHLTLYKTGVR